MYDFQGYFSRTFQDLKLYFSGHFGTSDFRGLSRSWNFLEKNPGLSRRPENRPGVRPPVPCGSLLSLGLGLCSAMRMAAYVGTGAKYVVVLHAIVCWLVKNVVLVIKSYTVD